MKLIFKISKFHNKVAGFTLVELLIYMGILSVILIVLTDILVAAFGVQASSQSTSQVAQDGRYIYSRLIYDINQASDVSTPSALGNTTNTLTLNKDGTTYTYALSGANLVVTDNSGTYQLNSVDTSLSSLQFQRIGNPGGKHTFRISFTVNGIINLNGRFDSKAFLTTAGLR